MKRQISAVPTTATTMHINKCVTHQIHPLGSNTRHEYILNSSCNTTPIMSNLTNAASQPIHTISQTDSDVVYGAVQFTVKVKGNNIPISNANQYQPQQDDKQINFGPSFLNVTPLNHGTKQSQGSRHAPVSSSADALSFTLMHHNSTNDSDNNRSVTNAHHHINSVFRYDNTSIVIPTVTPQT